MNITRRPSGFSLVELMVGMAIGLIGIIVIMQIFAFSEGQKRTTTSGADAQNNGNIALYGVMRDLRQAGYGLSLDSYGCTVNTSFGNNIVNPGPFTLAPVVITDGGVDGSGDALPDAIRALYSTATMGSLPNLLTVNHAQTDTLVNLKTNFGIAFQSLFVFWESGKSCTLAQVTSNIVDNTQIVHDTGSWNGNTTIFPAAGYAANASVLPLGGMALRTYSIDTTNNSLQMTDVSGAYGASASSSFVLASEIVNLQVQYGKDTGAHAGHTAGDNIVDAWDTATPASGVGGPATAAPWQQIIAVRLAILARAGQYEKPATPGGPCTVTTAAPTWSGGTMAVPGGLPSCYRYKVYETVVPLRNILWGI